MKKILFFATAMAVATSSLAPFVTVNAADNSGANNQTVTISDLKVETVYDGLSGYASHTNANPYVGNIPNVDAAEAKFAAKATLPLKNVAEKWNELKGIAEKAGVDLTTVSLEGDFTVTVTYDNNITYSDAALNTVVALDSLSSNYFTLSTEKSSVSGNTYTVVFSLDSANATYARLDSYFSSTDRVISADIKGNTISGTTVQSVGAQLSNGSVNIKNKSGNSIAKVNFNSNEAKDYLQLKVPEKYTKPSPLPTAAPTEAPTATPTAMPTAEPGGTPVPTAEPTATPAPTATPIVDNGVSVNVGNGYTPAKDVNSNELGNGNNLIENIDTNQDTNAIVVEVKDNSGKELEYGEDYYATYTDGGKKYDLSKNDYEMIKSGQFDYIQDSALKDAVDKSKDNDAVYSNIDVVVPADTNISITPVYTDKNGEELVIDTLGSTINAATASPAPTAEPTKAPTHSGGGGGGGSASVATATPKVTATPAPVVTTNPDSPAIDYENHVAYIIGYDDNTVRPANNITRAEVATIFFRLLTDNSRVKYWKTTNDFSDVVEDNWFNNAISTVANAGIVTGYENGTFNPNAPITRAEFATIAARFASNSYTGDDLFTDIKGHWAEDYINKAASIGWVTGYDDGTFGPAKNITRAEAMTIVNRVTYRLCDTDGIHKDAIKWIDNDPSAWYYANVEEATNAHTYTRDGLGSYETWTKVLPSTDWSELETKTAQSAAAQSGTNNGAIDINGNNSSIVTEESKPTATPVATEAPTATPAA